MKARKYFRKFWKYFRNIFEEADGPEIFPKFPEKIPGLQYIRGSKLESPGWRLLAGGPLLEALISGGFRLRDRAAVGTVERASPGTRTQPLIGSATQTSHPGYKHVAGSPRWFSRLVLQAGSPGWCSRREQGARRRRRAADGRVGGGALERTSASRRGHCRIKERNVLSAAGTAMYTI